MSVNFAEELRTRRLDARLSQEELAEAAQVSASAIGAYERGVRKTPHRQTVLMLADALHLRGSERAEFEAAARATHRLGRKSLSYNRLGPLERLLYRRLGTFPDAFTAHEVFGVCTGPDLSQTQALSALAALVETSIVLPDDTREASRYRLSGVARLFAIEKAIENDEVIVNVRSALTWALGVGAAPLLAARIVRHPLLRWIDRREQLEFLNMLGATLANIELDEMPSQELEVCWSLLADGLDEVGQPLRACAARKCAGALALTG